MKNEHIVNSFLSSTDRQFYYYTKYFAIDWRTKQILSKWPWRYIDFIWAEVKTWRSSTFHSTIIDDLKKVHRLNAAKDQMLHEVGFQLEKAVWLFHWWRRCVDIWIDSSFECIVIVFEWQVTMVIRIVWLWRASQLLMNPKKLNCPRRFTNKSNTKEHWTLIIVPTHLQVMP